MICCCQMTMYPEEYRRRTRGARRRARRGRRALLAGLFGGLLVLAMMLVPAIWQGMSGGEAPGHQHRLTLIRQNPELPNGCEVTSMAMALGAAGCAVDKLTLYGCLPREPVTESAGHRFGPDPELAYAGDAAKEDGGWYCFEGPLLAAANHWLEAQGSALRAASVTGLSRAELDGYAGEGTPVVCWVTLEYAQPVRSDSYTWLLPDGSVYKPYRNLHCVVLAGASEDGYEVADPLNGMCQVGRDVFWDSFSAMGSRAVVVMGN